MKVSVHGGEGFPIYEIHCADGHYTEIEVSEDVLYKWKTAFKNFTDMQKEIIEELKKQGHEDKVWIYGNGYSGYHAD